MSFSTTCNDKSALPMAPLHPWLLQWLRTERLPDADPDHWRQLLANAEQHGFIPLLHAAVMRASQSTIPEQAREVLAAGAAQTAARNLLLADELQCILRAARARGVACVPLRGVTLAERLYGHVAMRPTGDIDLLVRREALAGVRALLTDQGYVEVEPRAGFAEAFDYTLEFFKLRGLLLIVEPHWGIAYPPLGNRLNMDDVWRRCVDGMSAGVPTTLLGTEDLLLHLCCHALHHHEAAPALWCYELDRFIRRAAINWPLLAQIAEATRLGLLLLPALSQTQAMFRTPLPATLFDQLSRAPLSRSERMIARLLTSPRPIKGRERLAIWLGLPGLRHKLRYAWSWLFPTRQFIRAQYGVTSGWQGAWTYVTRVGGQLWCGVQGLVQLLRGTS